MTVADTRDSAHPRSLIHALRAAAADVKLAHSVFALPFAVLGAFLVAPRAGNGVIAWRDFALMLPIVVACMFFARTWAMLFNRIADARIDARNPRTAGRAIPAGRLTPRAAWTLALACCAAFIGSAALFGPLFSNWWPAILSVPVLLWIAFYSLTKRFTALCHIFLGGALAASPLAAALAVGPGLLPETPAVWFLSAMVLCWVAGFDIIYALQDLDFDRQAGLHSVPAAVGWRWAAWSSRALHAAALAALVYAWRADPRLGTIFGIAVALVAALLIAEHAILAKRGKAGLDMAFFTLNGIVSCLLGIAGIADLLP
ncbi:MAG: putative 4-hydroxybenzoate polyprenyltransferase [Phycisphaeraceae bacterium]|nr:putative 4-hydroxybenzoate polyprenyltransferase [Phycisphaeraceae bacterium]MBX3368121.1 putative 4-hydroxybenzoate polyprenyltransferase [Phycisphaeraceae bacterium]